LINPTQLAISISAPLVSPKPGVSQSIILPFYFKPLFLRSILAEIMNLVSDLEKGDAFI
jgi:hypothetical protein